MSYNFETTGAAQPKIILAALAPALLVAILAWTELPYRSPDSGWYLRLAEGRAAEVVQPFANRVLFPGLVQMVVAVTGWSTDTAFRLLALLALATLCLAVAYCLGKGSLGWPVALVVRRVGVS